ncbi:MAG: 2-phospho-L-lactate guanylyltransferase [Rhodobacteraceae bacterium]|nr:2-phospho-L-lactate guanylyltransferase [Paracoccaceae bacterium]
MADLLFIIPMKNPADAKTRLAASLPVEGRKRLAMLLYRQLLQLLRGQFPAYDVLVVTGSSHVAELAKIHGAKVLEEQETNGGLNAAISQAAGWAKRHGYAAICALPADLADPAAADITHLLQVPRNTPSLLLCPSYDGGTNCLIASPPDAVAFCYGLGSCKAHQAEAAAADIPCMIMPLSSIAYDIDTSDDLATFVKNRGALWA